MTHTPETPMDESGAPTKIVCQDEANQLAGFDDNRKSGIMLRRSASCLLRVRGTQSVLVQ